MSDVYQTCVAETDFQNDVNAFLKCINEGFQVSSGGDETNTERMERLVLAIRTIFYLIFAGVLMYFVQPAFQKLCAAGSSIRVVDHEHDHQDDDEYYDEEYENDEEYEYMEEYDDECSEYEYEYQYDDEYENDEYSKDNDGDTHDVDTGGDDENENDEYSKNNDGDTHDVDTGGDDANENDEYSKNNDGDVDTGGDDEPPPEHYVRVPCPHPDCNTMLVLADHLTLPARAKFQRIGKAGIAMRERRSSDKIRRHCIREHSGIFYEAIKNEDLKMSEDWAADPILPKSMRLILGHFVHNSMQYPVIRSRSPTEVTDFVIQSMHDWSKQRIAETFSHHCKKRKLKPTANPDKQQRHQLKHRILAFLSDLKMNYGSVLATNRVNTYAEFERPDLQLRLRQEIKTTIRVYMDDLDDATELSNAKVFLNRYAFVVQTRLKGIVELKQQEEFES